MGEVGAYIYNTTEYLSHGFIFDIIILIMCFREKFLKDAEHSAALSALSSLLALVEKMEKNEVISTLTQCWDVLCF